MYLLKDGSGGYHLCHDAEDIVLNIQLGLAIYEAEECRGESAQKLNWGERQARLYACDCADQALIYWAQVRPVDKRCREAVGVARRFALGDDVSKEELVGAACAAEAAGWNMVEIRGKAEGKEYARCSVCVLAAWSTTWAAGDSVWAAWGAATNARHAAEAAAYSIGWSGGDELYWQAKRLRQYLYGRVSA